MKKISILSIVAVFCIMAVQAQQPGPPRFDAKEMARQTVNEFSQKVKLTSSVKDSISSVYVKFFQEMEKNMKPGERPDMEEIRKIENTRETRIKSFLTEEQYRIYIKFVEGKRSQRREHPGGNDHQGPPPDRRE